MKRLRAFGPAAPRPALPEALRTAIGAGFGLAVATLALWLLSPSASPLEKSLLIAPFGASAFLIFVAPASPLAQPWAVVVGNTLAALAAYLVLQLHLPPPIAAPLAVTLAVLAMASARALHPPGGAVALFVALAAPQSALFALNPVLSGSFVLVASGILWHRIMGHAYPRPH